MKQKKIIKMFAIVVAFSAVISFVTYWCITIFMPSAIFYNVIGDSVSLYKSSDYPMTLKRFDYAADEDRFTALEYDPQIIFDNVNFSTESILITFAEAIEEETTLVIFYSNETFDFSEYTRIDLSIPDGVSEFYIDTAKLDLNSIRFDIMGDFTLSSIILSNEDMILQRDRFPAIFISIISFAISFLAIACLCCLPQTKKRILEITKFGLRKIFEDLLPAYILLFVGCFMLFIFEPILTYAMNMNVFWFDFSIMLWPVLTMFCIFLIIGILFFSIIYFINVLFSQKLLFYKALLSVGFILFFLLYVQGNWLAGNLPILTGDEINWSNYGQMENLLLIFCFIVLAFAIIIDIYKFKFSYTIKYATIGTLIVGIMLFVSLIPTIISQDALKDKESFNANTNNFNVISSNKNFLIFLVDTVDSYVFNEVLESDKDFDGLFDDFTYYTDAMGYYMHTRDSIPLILSGYINKNEKNFNEFSSDAYNNSLLFEELDKNGYSINLYTRSIIWDGTREYDIQNSSSIRDWDLNLEIFIREELKYIKFKYLPYNMKKFSKIETLNFNACIESSQQNEAYYGDINNLLVYPKIINNQTLDKTETNYFQFVHVEGAHPPFNLDKNLTLIEDGTYEQKIEASLTMIQTYINRLKSNNAYDNSVIVVMADHGYHASIPEELGEYWLLSRANPILLIKGINEKHELIKSDIPVSFVDLQYAFKDLTYGKTSIELFSDIDKERIRNCLWLIWGQENHMVEFENSGTARDYDKFTPTGKIYDLN